LSQQVGLKRNEIYFFKDALAPLIFDIVFYKNLPTFTLVFPNTVFVAVEEEEVPDVVDKDTFILFELSMLLLSFEFGKGLLVDVDDSAKSVVAVVVDVVVNIDIGCEVEGNWLMISLVDGLLSFIELAPPNTLAVSSNISVTKCANINLRIYSQ